MKRAVGALQAEKLGLESMKRAVGALQAEKLGYSTARSTYIPG
ncbi:hypothetical protein [Paenibacillus sp. 1011MAR3C5]|nr:hypothetical protein [Paenibacillus sp. 1011MAR3C5]